MRSAHISHGEAIFHPCEAWISSARRRISPRPQAAPWRHKLKKNTHPPRLRRWLVAGIFLLIFLAILGLTAYGYTASRIVHVERTTVYLEDLPPGFDGKTILFVSDIDMVGLSGPYAAKGLFDSLEKLGADILILGGDYAGESLLEKLNSTGDALKMEENRRELFSHLADFSAPLGKYAVAGENDAAAEDIAGELALGRISYLSDSAGSIQLGEDKLILIGLKDYSEGSLSYDDIARHIDNNDCVIAITHNPASVSGVMTSEAGNTGQWADLVLTGHTHHGQAVVGERSLIQLDQQESRYANGWSKESGVYILVSPGAGCDTVNFRLNTRAQAHLITLRRGMQFNTGQ